MSNDTDTQHQQQLTKTCTAGSALRLRITYSIIRQSAGKILNGKRLIMQFCLNSARVTLVITLFLHVCISPCLTFSVEQICFCSSLTPEMLA